MTPVDTVAGRIGPGEDRRMAGRRPGAGRNGRRVERRICRQGVEMRCRPAVMPVAREVIASERVDDDEDDVGKPTGRHDETFVAPLARGPGPEASFTKRSASGPTLNRRSTIAMRGTKPPWPCG